MARKYFHGVDMEMNYARALLQENDPKKKEKLVLKKNFKAYVMKLDRILKKEMIVVDSDMVQWKIISIRGRNAEKKTFLLDKVDGVGTKECDMTEIFPLDIFEAAQAALENQRAAGMTDRKAEARPAWFDIAEKVKRKTGLKEN